MRTLVPGYQGTTALGPGPRAFFFKFFFGGSSFFFKKKLYFLSVFSLFLSLSLFLCTHTLGSLEFNEFHESKL
jgi:hypothetical protein